LLFYQHYLLQKNLLFIHSLEKGRRYIINVIIKNILIITNNKQSSLFCNIPLTPDIYKLIFVYFTQGIYTIYRVYLSFYYKDVLHLTPYDLTIISTIPLIIKPIYEFLPELFPLFTYKKNAFLLLSGILGSISWALLAFFNYIDK